MRRSIHRKYVPRNNIEQAFSFLEEYEFHGCRCYASISRAGEKGGGEVISYTTILALQPVVNRFVVNVALGCIDVNASAGLKNVSQGFAR